MNRRLTRREALSAASTALVATGLAGCGSDGERDENTVEMTNGLAFEPDRLTVAVGETVTWENVGSTRHTVTAYEDGIPDGAEYFASGNFDSEAAARNAYTPGSSEQGDIDGGSSYEHTFETVGTYEYFCIPHESTMTGTIVVTQS